MAAFELQGGVIDQSADAQSIRQFRGAEAATYNDNTILLTPNPTASQVFEELIHVGQFRRGLVDTSNTVEMEIQASEKLIRNRRPYQISNQETRETIQRLRELRQAAADKQE